MGYYTKFDLDVETGKHTISEIAKAIYEDKDTFYGLTEPDVTMLNDYSSGGFFLRYSDEVKWYTEPTDMKKFSKKFPDAIFIVSGYGEERSDVWEHRYKNGKMEERHQLFKWSEWEDYV